MAAVLLFAALGANSAQSAERAKARDPYGTFLMCADSTYTFIKTGAWDCSLYISEKQNQPRRAQVRQGPSAARSINQQAHMWMFQVAKFDRTIP